MDGRQREQLETALRAVFNVDTLQRWLRYTMDTRLDEVVGEGLPLPTTIFRLVDWAEREGRLDELIGKAAAANRDNPVMRAYVAKWPSPVAPAATAAAPAATTPANVDAGALRRAIASTFTLGELELLCADVEDALRQAGHDETLSLDAIGATGGLQNAALTLVRYLDRRGHLPTLAAVVRRVRPGAI